MFLEKFRLVLVRIFISDLAITLIMWTILFLLSVCLECVFAYRSSPSHSERAHALLRKVKNMISEPIKSLGEEEASSEGLSNGEIAGIVGGSVGFVIICYVIYRYKTWVPKVRAARAKGAVTSGSDSDRLISPK